MKPGVVRIIAGRWRGKLLKVPAVTHLRPTPDRVRETLFNWLAPWIAHSHCADLFAGSGVLGLEALSRGAASTTFVDASEIAINTIQATITQLNIQGAHAYCATLPRGIKPPARPFDIVFIDPPYQAQLVMPMCELLEAKQYLATHALIYLESPQALTPNDLPKNWGLIKQKQAGQVFYHLVQRNIHE